MHGGPIKGEFGVETQGEITIIELNESLRINRARYENNRKVYNSSLWIGSYIPIHGTRNRWEHVVIPDNDYMRYDADNLIGPALSLNIVSDMSYRTYSSINVYSSLCSRLSL